jgi:hypothetical protein
MNSCTVERIQNGWLVTYYYGGYLRHFFSTLAEVTAWMEKEMS